jgi:hypothetical protein
MTVDVITDRYDMLPVAGDEEFAVGTMQSAGALAVVDQVEAAETVDSADEYVYLGDGHRLKLVSYFHGDEAHAELTEKVIDGRKREFESHGLLKSGAKRDEILGSNVEIIALVDPETNEPIASLRKVHAPDNDKRQLPSYKKFAEAGTLSDDGLALFDSLAEGKNVVEIAALWKDDSFGTDVKMALYKKALHDSIARNELWFLGVVTPEYVSLKRMYGDSLIHTVGDPTPVKEDDAVSTVRIRPVVVDPTTIYEGFIDEINAAKETGDDATRFLREQMLWHYLSGLNWKLLDPATRATIEGYLNVGNV